MYKIAALCMLNLDCVGHGHRGTGARESKSETIEENTFWLPFVDKPAARQATAMMRGLEVVGRTDKEGVVSLIAKGGSGDSLEIVELGLGEPGTAAKCKLGCSVFEPEQLENAEQFESRNDKRTLDTLPPPPIADVGSFSYLFLENVLISRNSGLRGLLWWHTYPIGITRHFPQYGIQDGPQAEVDRNQDPSPVSWPSEEAKSRRLNIEFDTQVSNSFVSSLFLFDTNRSRDGQSTDATPAGYRLLLSSEEDEQILGTDLAFGASEDEIKTTVLIRRPGEMEVRQYTQSLTLEEDLNKPRMERWIVPHNFSFYYAPFSPCGSAAEAHIRRGGVTTFVVRPREEKESIEPSVKSYANHRIVEFPYKCAEDGSELFAEVRIRSSMVNDRTGYVVITIRTQNRTDLKVWKVHDQTIQVIASATGAQTFVGELVSSLQDDALCVAAIVSTSYVPSSSLSESWGIYYRCIATM